MAEDDAGEMPAGREGSAVALAEGALVPRWTKGSKEVGARASLTGEGWEDVARNTDANRDGFGGRRRGDWSLQLSVWARRGAAGANTAGGG